MTGVWYRTGDFSHKEMKGTALVRQINFINAGRVCTIKKIYLRYYHNGHLSLSLSPSSLHRGAIAAASQRFFPRISHLDTSNTISIELGADYHTSTRQFIKLLTSLNKKHHHEEFPQALFRDLQLIPVRLFSGLAFRWHIEKLPDLSSHVNPQRKNSSSMMTRLTHNELSLTEAITCLQYGEDPNQEDFLGKSLLYAVIIKNDAALLRVTLWYGADPFKRSLHNVLDDNGFEIARSHHRPDMFNILMQAFSFPRKSPARPRYVTKVNTASSKQEILTQLAFSNETQIISRLMPTSRFHTEALKKEKSATLALFQKSFESPDGDMAKVKQNFAHEFSPASNKWIDLIQGPEGAIWGFNLFRIENLQGKWVCKCEYAAIDQDSPLRNKGISPFFSFRVALALQYLMPNETVVIYYLALHYYSFCLMKGELATPKYRSDTMDRLNQKLLADEFGKEITLNQGGVFTQPCLLRVQGNARKGSSFDESCYDEFVRMEFARTPTVTAAVVSTVVGPELLSSISERLDHGLQISLPEHIHRLGARLYQQRHVFFPSQKQKLPEKIRPSFNWHSQIGPFWAGKKAHAETTENQQTLHARL